MIRLASEHRTLLGVVALLLLALAGTAGLRQWQVERVASAVERRQARAVEEALDAIEREFAGLQRAMRARARSLAASEPLAEGLRRHALGDAAGREALLRHVVALELPPQWAVEVYDASMEVLVWNGFSMPLDPAPARIRFFDGVQTAVAEDTDWRRAVALWLPVSDGARPLGAVRVLRLVHVRRPVQNQYLEDYRLADQWRRRVGLPVEVDFQPPLANPAPARATVLRGIDGTVLGRVAVVPPPPEALVDAVRARHDDVLAFWTALLLLTLVAALWRGYRRRPAASRLAVVAGAWVGTRFALLALGVPGRWQGGKAPLAPLFDPSHLASTFGGGMMRSTGDLLISAAFLLALAFAVLGFAARRRPLWPGAWYEARRSRRRLAGFAARLGLVTLAVALLTLLPAAVARHAILDSTLDFFTREGLFPRPLVLIVYCALLLTTLAVLVLAVAAAWLAFARWGRGEKPNMPVAGWAAALAAAAAVALPSLLLYAAGLGRVLPLTMALAFVAVGLGVAAGAVRQRGRALEWLTLRSVLPITLLAGILLYPLVFRGLDVQRRQRMQDAAEFFDEGRDPGVLFALEQVLSEAAASPVLRRALAAPPGDARRQDSLDSLAMTLLRTALPATRTPYDVNLRFLDAEGRTAGWFGVSEQRLGPAALDQLDADVFEIARQMYAERGEGGPLVDQLTGREPDRFQYVGLLPVGDPPEGWILAQAEPRPLWQQGGGVPLLRVLLPSGYGNLYASLSLAEFRDGVLVRSSGRDFGRYRLDPAVRQALVARDDLWRSERVDERRYLSYYRREPFEARMPLLTPEQQMIDAVRVPAFAPFDHLYYLLRLTVAGLMIGLLFFGAGLVLRRRAGVLPAPRVRFRDKVLNAFLAVGIFAILAVGALGVRVVSEENERAVQSWLRQHLERVEDALVLEARGEELPYRVVERVRLDSLAARVGLDLNLYRDGRLIRSSRPQFRYERLLDERLPIGAYEALYFDGYKFTYAEERLGRFRYTAGYRALLDEEGHPAYVVSIPTLPEQERIEEERARTLAYLFGALLLLVVVVMATAALLANALARPVARLRTGLRDVARGRFERKLPVGTRDEIGELVETFNEMQEQLAESRRKLAQQERQLAWREMARQVAHEIKNPLTPMKLSVQHLRRTFDDAAADEAAPAPAPDARFARLFERVTGTLIEQIDTLARIANDFSTFARMPTRVLERLDLNEVVRQAVRLMQAEAEAEIALDLAPEPLVVEADQEELRRTFINLLKNAIQALPEDGAGAVRVTTQREGEAAYAAVIDTGTGIPDALHAKIFEPNFSTKTSGTGLGLAIARKTVEEHGGAIGFETEAGVGTTFWVRLPLAEA